MTTTSAAGEKTRETVLELADHLELLRLELEDAERAAAAKRAELAEAEQALIALTQRAARSRRPRVWLPGERAALDRAASRPRLLPR